MPRWSGSKDQGPRNYELAERERVLTTMATAQGEDKALAIDVIASLTGLEARTVRAILSEADGVAFVLAYTDDQRVYLAQWREEADRYTTKLEAQVRTMRDRMTRRSTLSSSLPYRQGRLI